MVAKAMLAMPSGPGHAADPTLSIADLVEHWLALEESIRADARIMLAGGTAHSFALLSLEQIAASPRETLVRLVGWLGLGAELSRAQEVWVAGVHRAPNAKYAGQYTSALAADPSMASAHEGMVAAYATRVRSVSGYELSNPEQYSHPPTRGVKWWRAWLGEDADEKTLETLLLMAGS